MTPIMETKQAAENAPKDSREDLLMEAFRLLLKMDDKQISEVLQKVRSE